SLLVLESEIPALPASPSSASTIQAGHALPVSSWLSPGEAQQFIQADTLRVRLNSGVLRLSIRSRERLAQDVLGLEQCAFCVRLRQQHPVAPFNVVRQRLALPPFVVPALEKFRMLALKHRSHVGLQYPVRNFP